MCICCAASLADASIMSDEGKLERLRPDFRMRGINHEPWGAQICWIGKKGELDEMKTDRMMFQLFGQVVRCARKGKLVVL